MAKSKDDITFGTSQARLTEDEAVRVVYKHGTPLEGGKIADSEPSEEEIFIDYFTPKIKTKIWTGHSFKLLSIILRSTIETCGKLSCMITFGENFTSK
ncbi:hypothetical protein Lal_00034773 [Lupinus albus]|nr:hypothetical protein Lal_00034773 [Lupinus albus]